MVDDIASSGRLMLEPKHKLKANWTVLMMGIIAAIFFAYLSHFVNGPLYVVVWVLGLISLVIAWVKGGKRSQR